MTERIWRTVDFVAARDPAHPATFRDNWHHAFPVRNANTIPVNAARSSAGRRKALSRCPCPL